MSETETLTRDQSPTTENGRRRRRKGRSVPRAPDPPATPAAPQPPQGPTPDHCQEKKRCRGPSKRRHPPNPRGVEIFFLRHRHRWTQRRIADKYGIAPSSVRGYLERTEKYFAHAGVPRPDRDLPAADQLRLALDLELIATTQLLEKTRKLSALALEPHQTTHRCVEGNEERWRRTIERCDPPRVGWTNSELRLIERIGKLRQSLAAADATLFELPLPRDEVVPGLPNALSAFQLPAPTGGQAAAKQKNASGVGHRTCVNRNPDDYIVTPAELAAYWRYQGLGLEQGLGPEDREDLVRTLLSLDGVVVQAAAMEDDQAPGTASGYTAREYVELLLILDNRFSRELCARIMAHYDAERREFNWRVPREDLRWVYDEEIQVGKEESGGEGMAESGGAGETEGAGDSGSPALPHTAAPTLPRAYTEPGEIPYVGGPPQEVPADWRQWWIDRGVDKQVLLVRLDDTLGHGKHLHDIANDQHSVIIYELVEEVVREARGTGDEGPGTGGKGLGTRDEGLGTNGSSPAPRPDPLAPRPERLAPRPERLAPPPAPLLTPQLREKLFRELAPEGVAVLTHDGQIYKGPHLGRCGLVQRGILILRELCHSTPPWGESIWSNFQPQKK